MNTISGVHKVLTPQRGLADEQIPISNHPEVDRIWNTNQSQSPVGSVSLGARAPERSLELEDRLAALRAGSGVRVEKVKRRELGT